MGVSGISQIETGTRNPSVATLWKIADALGVEVGDLFPKAQSPLPFDEAAGRSLEERIATSNSLERVMNSIRNALGMPKTEIAREPRRPWNPHFYAIFAQVHNTL
jgi:transcriptional regulator with XRE-family HTH domain